MKEIRNDQASWLFGHVLDSFFDGMKDGPWHVQINNSMIICIVAGRLLLPGSIASNNSLYAFRSVYQYAIGHVGK